MATNQSVTTSLLGVLTEKGARQYGSECASQVEHAVQCAWRAERDSGDPALITAALFHDIGHMLHRFGENAAPRGIDDRHEMLGYKLLRKFFGDPVCMPVKLHVDAKRYLCAVEAGYFEGLSAASVHSLELQGGPFSAAEAKDFVETPFARDAVRLRRWDEAAKEAELPIPEIDHFRPYIDHCIGARTGADSARVA
jgi:phosphonate degradation associated HDIG domain protein